MTPGDVPQTLDPIGKEAFAYQLDFLKLEFVANNQIIDRIDDTTGKVKNWAIATWAGSVTLGLGRSDLRKYLWLTAIPPLLFFIVDAWWRRIQRTVIFRINKISEFLNDDRLQRSFQERKLIQFRVVDPRAQQHRPSKEFRSFTSLWRTVRFVEVAVFYLGISALSIAIWWSLNH